MVEKIKKSNVEKFERYLLDHESEINYIAGTVVTGLTTPLPGGDALTNLSPTILSGVFAGLYYADGVLSIALGLQQLSDTKNYRQQQQKVKGVLNIMAGVELCVLSTIGLAGGPALAVPAFALSMLIELITASIDLYNAYRESDFESWLEERVKEVNFQDNLLKDIALQIEDLELLQLLNGKKDKALLTELNALRKEWNEINNYKNILLEQMQVRCHVHYYDGKPEEQKSITKTLAKMTDSVIEQDNFVYEPAPIDRAKEIKIQTKLTQQFEDARYDIAFKAVSFIGITLLAVGVFFPPVLIPGVLLTSLVASYYLVENAEKIGNQLVKAASYIKNNLFQPAPQKVIKINDQTFPDKSNPMFSY